MSSETMALAESADTGHFVTLMTKQIFGLKAAPRVFCKTDNKSLKGHEKSSAWSNNQFILLVMYKWIEDKVWMQYTLH